ncbi:CDP-glycerol glycerophosphotransferase family protein, partial [Oharaeibacter diazotrophicus]
SAAPAAPAAGGLTGLLGGAKTAAATPAASAGGPSQAQLDRLQAKLVERVDQRAEQLLDAQMKIAEGTSKALQQLAVQVRATRQVAAFGARGRTRRRWRVVFLVHFVEAWEALVGVHRSMLGDPDFDVIVATLPRWRRDRRAFEYEDAISAVLTEQGIDHIRLGGEGEQGIEVLRALAPDVVFRQSPWDSDIPPQFAASELGFTRICYVPYVYYSANFDPQQYDQPLHRLAWRYFSANADDLAQYSKVNLLRGRNAVLTGYPKFDAILDLAAGVGDEAWPIRRPGRSMRVIYAPHLSIGGQGLGFGNFPEVYRDVFRLARENQDVEFVFKPHPTLLDVCVASKLMSEGDVRWFEENWAKLPNTATVTSNQYARLFAASDALISEGISFFSEYTLFDKPLIFHENRTNKGLNAAGAFLYDGLYRVKSFPAAVAKLREVLAPGGDTLAPARAANIRRLRPFPGEAARNVVEAVRAGLAEECPR